MTPATVVALHTQLHAAALPRPWGERVTANHVVTARVTASDGRVGTGFGWTPTIGPHAVRALLEHDIAPWLLGREAHPETVWDPLWKHLHEAGSGGLTTIAMAAVDLALWDLRAASMGLSLVDCIGRVRDTAPVYGSGVNLHYSIDELVAQVRRWVSAGFGAVKVKVGRPDLGEDVERIAAVRDTLGPDRLLMIDANQRWDLPTARRAIDALARFDLEWIEEPLRADDARGYARLRDSIAVPVALGENVYTAYRFRELIEAGACDVVQPNIVRVGGITPFRRIVELARASSVRTAPHLLPELSAQLALTTAEPVWVEDVEDASFDRLGLLAEPTGVRIRDGWARVENRPGLGFRFRASALTPPPR